MLERLEIENYKSLHKVGIDLPAFAVIVGANAAGKSNFADALEFLSIVAKNGLPTAVTDKGGYENICFRRTRRAKGAIRFFVRVTGVDTPGRLRKGWESRYEWDFSFKAARQTISSEFTVLSERFSVSQREVKGERTLSDARPEESDSNEPWSIVLSYEYPTEGSGVHVAVSEKPTRGYQEYLDAVLKDVSRGSRDDLVLTSRFRLFPHCREFLDYLSGLRIFQIMPDRARQPASASGTRELGKNGENLPAALHRLRKDDPQAYETLIEYLRLAVPTVEELQTSYVETRELGLFLKEQVMKRRQYASELSDGTLRTIAIFLPLVDPRYSLVVIEEPENSIHPWVTRHFVAACRERSSDKQMILTTHSPVLVASLKPSELFIAERRNGESAITPATLVGKEVEEIIRKGIMNLGAYWDSGAMRAVPSSEPSIFEKLPNATKQS